jgi:hypothetical protein
MGEINDTAGMMEVSGVPPEADQVSGKQSIEQRAWSIGSKTKGKSFFLYALCSMPYAFPIRNPHSQIHNRATQPPQW